jgi:nicotinamide-nucleotide amidase
MTHFPAAEILSVGSELLTGETVDTNAAFLAGELTRLGFEVTGVRQLPDDLATLRDAFAEARSRSPLVVATGGLGPTHDDVSREALAEALGEQLTRDPALEAALRERFRAYGNMPEANLKQAMRIPSAQPIPNPIGSAPGWWVDLDGRVTVLLPGVPSEMRRMWSEEVAARLTARFGVQPPHVRVVKTFGVGESALAERLGSLLTEPPHGVRVGIYARDDGVNVRYTTRTDAAAADRLAAAACELLESDAYGTDGADLADIALHALARRGARRLATVESGTAGALAALLSDAPQESGLMLLGGLVLPAGTDASTAPAAPAADATLCVDLDAPDGHGRSRVHVWLDGRPSVQARWVRVHGSGPQRLRRAAYAALDIVRRELR